MKAWAMKRSVLNLIMAACAALASVPVSAMLPAAPDTPQVTASQTPEQTIDDTQEAGSDTRIANRIRGIFGELPAFSQVQVEVQQGVVSLAGTVPAQDDIARAETIAGRIAGVVTVENAIERDLQCAFYRVCIHGLNTINHNHMRWFSTVKCG